MIDLKDEEIALLKIKNRQLAERIFRQRVTGGQRQQQLESANARVALLEAACEKIHRGDTAPWTIAREALWASRGSDSVSEDVELDSPNFTPPELTALAGRGYERVNAPKMSKGGTTMRTAGESPDPGEVRRHCVPGNRPDEPNHEGGDESGVSRPGELGSCPRAPRSDVPAAPGSTIDPVVTGALADGACKSLPTPRTSEALSPPVPFASAFYEANPSDEILEDRTRLLDEVCTWLETCGWKDAAETLHRRRAGFQLQVSLYICPQCRLRVPENAPCPHCLAQDQLDAILHDRESNAPVSNASGAARAAGEVRRGNPKPGQRGERTPAQ